MSLIWIILVNAIIGMVLYPISIYLIIWYADKKYGYDVTKESSEDNLKTIEDFSCLTGVDNRFLLYLTIVVSIIFWEIAIPINAYGNITKIKDLHELRGGNDRLIVRRKDEDLKELKEYFECSLQMIDLGNQNLDVTIKLLNIIAEKIDPEDDLYDAFNKVIESLSKDKECFEQFLVTMDYSGKRK